jgi:ABC-type sugar transport system substrate-binding protein
MKKSALTMLLTLATAASCCLASCGSTAKTVEVLVQTADHGWTGAVQSYAAGESRSELGAQP